MSVAEQKTGPGLLVRALWFVFIGWWLTGIVSAIAWFAMVTIIGLPLGIWLINRIPTSSPSARGQAPATPTRTSWAGSSPTT